MRRSTLIKAGAALALVAVLAVIAVIFVLLHGRAQPLALAQPTPRTPAASPSPNDPLAQACRRPAVRGSSSAGVAGLWALQPGSLAGYRAHEKFAELTSPHEAVARTDALSGWILVSGGSPVQLEAACIAIDVRKLRSVDELPGFNTADRDRSASDMPGVHEHPYVIFQPYPGALVLDPASTAVQHLKISGDLQISGVTKPATFSLDVRLQNNQLAAAGTTIVQVGDFGVEVPQEAGQFVEVDPPITLEVSLILLQP